MLLADISDQIAGNFDKWDDIEFKRRVEDLVITNRAELIRRNIDKYGVTPNNLIQQINCIPTTQVDSAECCSLTLGCNVTRSTNKVPNPIRIRSRNSNFKYVGTIDGRKSFSHIDREMLELLQGERFFTSGISYAYINEYIYVFGDNPANIRLQGVFGDPREVANLNDCDNPNTDCLDNVEIEEDLIRNVRIMVAEELINSNSRLKEDDKEVKLADEVNINS